MKKLQSATKNQVGAFKSALIENNIKFDRYTNKGSFIFKNFTGLVYNGQQYEFVAVTENEITTIAEKIGLARNTFEIYDMIYRYRSGAKLKVGFGIRIGR